MDHIDKKIEELRERQRAWIWTIDHNPQLGFLCQDLRREIKRTEAKISQLYAQKKA